MGTRGPIPKRDEERIRRNLPDTPTDVIQMQGPVVQPPLGIPDPHPFVVDMWIALGESGGTKYYEPSDWQYARLTLAILSDALQRGKLSAMMLTTVDQMLSKMLVTEADRRRLKIEVKRGEEQAAIAEVSQLFKDRFDKPVVPPKGMTG